MKIRYFLRDGTLQKVEPLSAETLPGTAGMLVRCRLRNGNTASGYADPCRTHHPDEYDGKVSGYIYLWRWENLDESSHELRGEDDSKYNRIYERIEIGDICGIDAVLYSAPRWGGLLTNSFPDNI